MEKKILATKAPSGFIVGEIIGMIFSGIVGIMWLFMGRVVSILPLFSLIFIGASIFCGYLAFTNIKNPYEMLYYDEEGMNDIVLETDTISRSITLYSNEFF